MQCLIVRNCCSQIVCFQYILLKLYSNIFEPPFFAKKIGDASRFIHLISIQYMFGARTRSFHRRRWRVFNPHMHSFLSVELMYARGIYYCTNDGYYCAAMRWDASCRCALVIYIQEWWWQYIMMMTTSRLTTTTSIMIDACARMQRTAKPKRQHRNVHIKTHLYKSQNPYKYYCILIFLLVWKLLCCLNQTCYSVRCVDGGGGGDKPDIPQMYLFIY